MSRRRGAALGAVVGLMVIGYVLTAVATLPLRLSGLAPHVAWWVGAALVLCGGLPVGGWLLWQNRRKAERPQAGTPQVTDPLMPRQVTAGHGPLDWVGEVDYLLESADLRALRAFADEADAQAGRLMTELESAWQRGSFEVELAAQARAAQAAAEVARTNLAFARIVAAERLRSRRSGLVS